MSKSTPPAPEPQDNIAVPLFDVQAFDSEGNRNTRAEQLAHPRGFIPAEEDRATAAAKRCNQLNLANVEFRAVPAETGPVSS